MRVEKEELRERGWEGHGRGEKETSHKNKRRNGREKESIRNVSTSGIRHEAESR